jgi:hypothetical protein
MGSTPAQIEAGRGNGLILRAVTSIVKANPQGAHSRCAAAAPEQATGAKADLASVAALC